MSAKFQTFKPDLSEPMPTVAEMMAELDAIAAANGIVWSGAEVATTDTSVRTRYATPGQRCGNGVVRKLSPKQVRFIKGLLAERDTRNLVMLPGSEDIENMSLRGARDLIDRLLACPMRADAPATRKPESASPEQTNYIRILLAEREVTPGTQTENLSKREASALITALKAAPYRPRETTASVPAPNRASASQELEAGIYLCDGTVYKVQRAVHGSGYMYAKKLTALDEPYTKMVRGKETKVTHEFVYAGIAPLRKLTAEMRMDLAQAIEFGAVYGVCVRCARTLTDEKSIERGIGPVCASKL